MSAGVRGVVPGARTEGPRPARSFAALLALLLVTVPLVALPAGPAAAANGVRVEVSSLTPAFGAPGGTLRVAGTVTNGGRQPLSEVVVRLRLSQSGLGSRSGLDPDDCVGGRVPQ